MKNIKPLILALCVAVLVTAGIWSTVAYLTSTDSVVNTFTVGKVSLKLDEASVDIYGTPDGTQRTEAGNEYHLIPGMSYTKDPTVTVLADSEEAYVRMLLTFNCCAELDEIFAPDGADLLAIFNGYDAATWLYVGETRDTAANTVTYEFRYKETVQPDGTDTALEPLFSSFTVPCELTGEQLETITGLEITAQAHAIQAAGFASAEEAWTAFANS